MREPTPFLSFLQAGFECSTQRRADGRRLDLLAATRHDQLAEEDYRCVASQGLLTIRDGLRWHLVEATPGRYDWSSFLPMAEAAERSGVQVVWDLCHYGWPDDVDIWSSAFVDRFRDFARAAAQVVRDVTPRVPMWCPVNEISFWAWAACDAGRFEPLAPRRGGELKRQLVRAAIAAIDAVREVDPRARILSSEPLVCVRPPQDRAGHDDDAALSEYHHAQHEAREMLVGRVAPELGGHPRYLDIVGVNYYSNNQWFLGGPTIELGHPDYRPLRELLAEVHDRHGRPIVVSETGAEGTAAAAWLFYVAGEVRAALEAGIPIMGICLYPILDYPGWENDRPCRVGLYGMVDAQGARVRDDALGAEVERQRGLFARLDRGAGAAREEGREA